MRKEKRSALKARKNGEQRERNTLVPFNNRSAINTAAGGVRKISRKDAKLRRNNRKK